MGSVGEVVVKRPAREADHSPLSIAEVSISGPKSQPPRPHTSMTCTGHFTLLFSADKVLGAMSDKALWPTVKVETGVSVRRNVALSLRMSVMTHTCYQRDLIARQNN